AQHALFGIDLPKRAMLPVERFADGLQDLGDGLGERTRLDERAGGDVLGRQAAIGLFAGSNPLGWGFPSGGHAGALRFTSLRPFSAGGENDSAGRASLSRRSS